MNTGNKDTEKPLQSEENTVSHQDESVVRKIVTPDMETIEESSDDSRSPGKQERDGPEFENSANEESSAPTRRLVTPDSLNDSGEEEDVRSPGKQERDFSPSDQTTSDQSK